MTKILNLDELEASVDKVLIFKGVSHEYRPYTVGEFITVMKTAEARDKAGEHSVSESVEYMVETINRSFPTVSSDDLRGLSLDRLRLITDFVNGVNEEEAIAPSPEGEEAAKKGKGKSK